MKLFGIDQIPKNISCTVLYYAGKKEDDIDTIDCAKGIVKALKRSGYHAENVVVTHDNWEEKVRSSGDVVFNLVEDETWELYANVAKRLEKLGKAQVGQNVAGLTYVTEKALLKRLMKEKRISTPPFTIYKTIPTGSQTSIPFPVIVKPSHEHAGIGISQKSVVSDSVSMNKQIKFCLDNFQGEVIAESYIKGREIHVTVMGNGKHIHALPLCEILFAGKFMKNWSVYSYDAKWEKKSWEYTDARVLAPAKMDTVLVKNIQELAVKAYRAFKCIDIVRMDVRVDENNIPYIVDLNMNPSLNYYDKQDATLASVYALGWTYEHFIEVLVAIAYKRIQKT